MGIQVRLRHRHLDAVDVGEESVPFLEQPPLVLVRPAILLSMKRPPSTAAHTLVAKLT